MNIEKLALKIIAAAFEKQVLDFVRKMKPNEKFTYDTCREDSVEVQKLVKKLKALGIATYVSSGNLTIQKTEEEKMDDLGYGMMNQHLDQNY